MSEDMDINYNGQNWNFVKLCKHGNLIRVLPFRIIRLRKKKWTKFYFVILVNLVIQVILHPATISNHLRLYNWEYQWSPSSSLSSSSPMCVYHHHHQYHHHHHHHIICFTYVCVIVQVGLSDHMRDKAQESENILLW